MKFLELLLLFLLFASLVIGLYLLWINLPTDSLEFVEYKANISQEFPQQSSQFYPNMRYSNKEISYKMQERCGAKKQNDVETALSIIEQKTVLEFYKSDEPEITILCSSIVPKAEDKDHYIAGEGGPTEIINSSKYAIIIKGEISLYRSETCDTPQISTHEILHALGFNHNSNEKSIMYPITDCEQTIDQEIINTINDIYSEQSYGDIAIDSVIANKTGRYLNFNMVMVNEGLKKIENSTLKLIIDNEIIATYTVAELDLGTKRFLSVKNQRIPRGVNEIKFVIETSQQELSKDNNEVIIKALQSD